MQIQKTSCALHNIACRYAGSFTGNSGVKRSYACWVQPAGLAELLTHVSQQA